MLRALCAHTTAGIREFVKVVKREENCWSEEEGLAKMAIIYGKENAEEEAKAVRVAQCLHRKTGAAGCPTWPLSPATLLLRVGAGEGERVA